QPRLAPLKRAQKGVGAGSQAPLKDDQSKGDIAALVTGERPVVLAVDVLGQGVVELFFARRLDAQVERLGLDVAGQEEGPAVKVAQILLDAPDEERIVVGADGRVEKVGRGKEAGLQQVEEEAKVLRITPVRGGGQKEQVGGDFGQGLAHAVTAGALQLVAVAVGAHLVRLVDD